MKLRINEELVSKSRNYANNIANNVQTFIDLHTTISVERSILRLLGIDGVNKFDVPLVNVIVDHVKISGNLGRGIMYYIGNAILELNKSPQEIAEMISENNLDISKLSYHPISKIKEVLLPLVNDRLKIIKENKRVRKDFIDKDQKTSDPEVYCIVATGNIYEDVTQAKAAARAGANIIAIIRSTGQSLLDYVPHGATTEGFGGTYATQENFKIMRKALDEVGVELNRYIKLVNYASGLCMSEIAALGALERLDVMLNDSLYGILFRDINMKRTFIDQYFSRVINAYAGIIINTGEDNYLTTADAFEEAHTVIASQLINEQFAFKANLSSNLQGLGHAFEIDPKMTNGFLFELASAQLSRQIFPNAPLKYMPPTKFMTGNIFQGQVQNAMFNTVSIMTNQNIHLLGMMTEAIHTPFLSDRFLSIENAKYVFNTMKDISGEIEFKEGGIIENRANEVLEKSHKLLLEIDDIGMFKAIENGVFANIKRPINGGKGLENVFKKDISYFNLFLDIMKSEMEDIE